MGAQAGATPITNVKISDFKKKKLAATALSGSYLSAPGHPCQVLVLNPVIQPGMALTIGSFYAIAATGMPTTMNLQLDHIQQAHEGPLYVFYEVRTRAKIHPLLVGDAAKTELEQVISALPWLDNYSFGAGVDAITGGISGQAVKPFTPTLRTVKTTATHIRFVEDENDFKQEVEASVSGKYNIEGVNVSASTSFLSSLSFSEVSTSLIAEFSSEYDGYDEADSYELTDEAKALLNDPPKFREAYGDYFISGGRRKSRFLAVYACKSTSSKSMNEFKASFGADAPDVFSAEGSARFMQAVSQSHVSLSIDLYMEGIEGDPPGGPWTPEKIIEALNWFIAHEKGVDMSAKLRHYSTLDPNYPRTIDVSPDAFVDLRELYTVLWECRGLFDSLPDYYQKQMKLRELAFDSSVTSNQHELATDADLRADLLKKGLTLLNDLDSVNARMAFYYKVVAVVGTEPPMNQVIEEGSGQQTWAYGFSSYPQSPAVVIHQTALRYQDSWHVGWREKTLEFGTNDGYLIVGWNVVSNWTDGTNGQWWKAIGTILLTSHGAVHVKSEYDRGCDWTVNYYYVDAQDYQFGS
jgi:hypothetical protein